MRLELTRRGDYAVRAAVALAREPAGSFLSAPEIVGRTGVPRTFIPQVMGDLVHAGLVEARLGRHGGYRLARPGADISLIEVVEAVEGDSRRRTCILRGGGCDAEHPCDVHHAFFRAQEALIGELAGATLASIVDR